MLGTITWERGGWEHVVVKHECESLFEKWKNPDVTRSRVWPWSGAWVGEGHWRWGRHGTMSGGEVVILSHPEWCQAWGWKRWLLARCQVLPRDLLTTSSTNRQEEKTQKLPTKAKCIESNCLNGSIKNPSYSFLRKGDFACIILYEFTWQFTML